LAPAARVANLGALPPALAANLERLSTRLHRDHQLEIDPLALVWERAVVLDLKPPPNPQTSWSEVCRLLPTLDGWIALTLSRPWDFEALAAWMGRAWTGDHWRAAAEAALTMTSHHAVEQADLLGMAAAACAEAHPFDDDQARSRGQSPPTRPWLVTKSEAPPRDANQRPRILDLSALWAGPLAGRILAEWGAEVIKVEDPGRPDGFREGAAKLYERLNGGKAQRSLSLDQTVALMEEADVVITSGRPRVWEQLGVPPLRGTWVHITGYGASGPWRNRVAFGDDAAIAGGLSKQGPGFVGDAIADPLTGIMAAAAALSGLEAGGGQVIDVAMREVVGWLTQNGPVASSRS
jgi:crotonobetainyl-CoA:carnitine CoA-transferase CaiB-like acyl-CoA transferase